MNAKSDTLFGVSVARVDGFRSRPAVNTDEDMVRVVLDMPQPTWRKLKNLLPPNTTPTTTTAVTTAPRCQCCGRYVHCECQHAAPAYEPDLFRVARIDANVWRLFPHGSYKPRATLYQSTQGARQDQSKAQTRAGTTSATQGTARPFAATKQEAI